MTVKEWMEKNGENYSYMELTIVNEDRSIILDDRIAYLDDRSADYNQEWQSRCEGRKIIREFSTPNGIGLQLEGIN